MLKIKNWNEFQHFKDRNPPWIKLYRENLYRRDIMSLSDRNFKILVCLWMLASEDKNKEGNLPEISDIAYKLRLSENDVTKAIKDLHGFLDKDDIDLISCGYQSDAPEKETETYSKEAEKETDIQTAFENYNLMAKKKNLTVVQKITASRKAKLKSRLKECGGIDGWNSCLENVMNSDFLTGSNKSGWKADFDFIVTESKFSKIMEGSYANKKSANTEKAKLTSQMEDIIQNGW